MQAIMVLAFGQLVSLVGTGMTRFAMSIWVWEQTKSATSVALVWVFIVAPSLIVGPIAGTLVDRWPRKQVMIVGDLVAGLTSVVLLLLFVTDSVQIWHLYLVGAVASAAEAFQGPAQMASVTLMVPREDHTRANGIISMAQFGSTVLSPVVAGVLYATIQFSGILVIDVVTFLVAVGTLLPLLIPRPRRTEEGATGGSVWSDTVAGMRYVLDRPPMLHVVYVFTVANFLFGLFSAMFMPMILARTGESSETLGWLLTINGIGGVVGGLLLSMVKGPERRIHGVLVGLIGCNLLGLLVVGIGQSFLLWAVGGFLATFFFPIINGCVMGIGQIKIAADLQGRVFGLLRTVAQATFPVAMLLAGVLADNVFRPAMQEGGSLAPIFGRIVGTGDGAGMSLLILIAAVLGTGVAVSGYMFRTVRDVEVLLPDQKQETEDTDDETGNAPGNETGA
jgi:MFS family permease